MSTNNTPWPQERLDILSQMWKSGSTGEEIASRLGISRSAALGRVRRLGLARNPTKPFVPIMPAPKRQKPAPRTREQIQELPPMGRLWSLDDATRRAAFARRAAAGAREALEAAGL